MAILELRAARGWSLKQTADTFLVTPATIASWLKRINDQGANALLQLREPVNKFPDFVRYIVQRLKTPFGARIGTSTFKQLHGSSN
jgi:transcriptional regulator with XRE-family HTH domain